MGKLPVVDFHTHVLPRMDDGSKSSAMSLQMLHRMHDGGTEIVVSTSHYYGRKDGVQKFLDRRAASYERLSARMDADCPKLMLGAEVAFFFGIETVPELDALCVQGTRTLLLEMPFSEWTDYELNAVASLCFDRGMKVVLAHLERFVEFQKGNDMIERMLALPVYVQINAGTLLPLLHRGRWIKMFAEHSAHVLGSDCHNTTTRVPNLDKARSLIHKKAGKATLDWIDACTNELLIAAPETERSLQVT